jgi:hypothetical protein
VTSGLDAKVHLILVQPTAKVVLDSALASKAKPLEKRSAVLACFGAHNADIRVRGNMS